MNIEHHLTAAVIVKALIHSYKKCMANPNFPSRPLADIFYSIGDVWGELSTDERRELLELLVDMELPSEE